MFPKKNNSKMLTNSLTDEIKLEIQCILCNPDFYQRRNAIQKLKILLLSQNNDEQEIIQQYFLSEFKKAINNKTLRASTQELVLINPDFSDPKFIQIWWLSIRLESYEKKLDNILKNAGNYSNDSEFTQLLINIALVDSALAEKKFNEIIVNKKTVPNQIFLATIAALNKLTRIECQFSDKLLPTMLCKLLDYPDALVSAINAFTQLWDSKPAIADKTVFMKIYQYTQGKQRAAVFEAAIKAVTVFIKINPEYADEKLFDTLWNCMQLDSINIQQAAITAIEQFIRSKPDFANKDLLEKIRFMKVKNFSLLEEDVELKILQIKPALIDQKRLERLYNSNSRGDSFCFKAALAMIELMSKINPSFAADGLLIKLYRFTPKYFVCAPPSFYNNILERLEISKSEFAAQIFEQLSKLLWNSDDSVCILALNKIRQLLEDNPAIVDEQCLRYLQECLTHKNEDVSKSAIEAITQVMLIKFNSPHIHYTHLKQCFFEYFQDKQQGIRLAAIKALIILITTKPSFADQDVMSHLQDLLLGGSDSSVKIAAIEALKQMAVSQKDLAGQLLKQLLNYLSHIEISNSEIIKSLFQAILKMVAIDPSLINEWLFADLSNLITTKKALICEGAAATYLKLPQINAASAENIDFQQLCQHIMPLKTSAFRKEIIEGIIALIKIKPEFANPYLLHLLYDFMNVNSFEDNLTVYRAFEELVQINPDLLSLLQQNLTDFLNGNCPQGATPHNYIMQTIKLITILAPIRFNLLNTGLLTSLYKNLNVKQMNVCEAAAKAVKQIILCYSSLAQPSLLVQLLGMLDAPYFLANEAAFSAIAQMLLSKPELADAQLAETLCEHLKKNFSQEIAEILLLLLAVKPEMLDNVLKSLAKCRTTTVLFCNKLLPQQPSIFSCLPDDLVNQLQPAIEAAKETPIPAVIKAWVCRLIENEAMSETIVASAPVLCNILGLYPLNREVKALLLGLLCMTEQASSGLYLDEFKKQLLLVLGCKTLTNYEKKAFVRVFCKRVGDVDTPIKEAIVNLLLNQPLDADCVEMLTLLKIDDKKIIARLLDNFFNPEKSELQQNIQDYFIIMRPEKVSVCYTITLKQLALLLDSIKETDDVAQQSAAVAILLQCDLSCIQNNKLHITQLNSFAATLEHVESKTILSQHIAASSQPSTAGNGNGFFNNRAAVSDDDIAEEREEASLFNKTTGIGNTN